MLKALIKKITEIPIIGLDMDGANLAVVQLARQQDEIRIARAEIRSVRAGYPGRLLQKFSLEMGFHRNRFAVGISSPETIVRPFSLPRISKKYVASAIALEAESAMLNGHSIDQMAIDWCEVPQQVPQTIRGVLVAIPKEELKSRLKMFSKAGIHPLIVDVRALTIWNAYWMLDACRGTGQGTVMFLNVGSQMTDLIVARGCSELVMVRDLHCGAAACESGRIEEFFSEVGDTLSYARSKHGLRQLDHIYVTGWGASEQVAADLASHLSHAVKLWNPLDFLSNGKEDIPDHAMGCKLSTAVGLALRKL